MDVNQRDKSKKLTAIILVSAMTEIPDRRHVGVLSGFFTRMTTHIVPIKEQLRASFIHC